jgi:type IV pilus assembly protein PilW
MSAMRTPVSRRPASRGVTLIEVLVGIVIGLIAILVIFQTISVWDARTRASASGGDAQVAGTIAMYNIERDIKQAGQGFAMATLPDLNCMLQGYFDGAVTTFGRLAPVEIIDGAGLPDEIRVFYGNSGFFTSREIFDSSSPTTKHMKRRNGFKPGDLAVVTDGSNGLPGTAVCQLIEITSDANPDGVTLNHDTAAYTTFYGVAASASHFNTAASAPFTGGNMYSLGPLPQRRVWTLSGDTLGFTETLHDTQAFAVADQIVDLKAQYGLDSDNDGRITDNAPNEWTKTLGANPDFSKVLAVRVAILVRSRNFEKPGAASAPSWSASNPVWSGGLFAMKDLGGTSDSFIAGDPDPHNWRNYRYRVFEKVIPLRNVIWATTGGPILP